MLYGGARQGPYCMVVRGRDYVMLVQGRDHTVWWCEAGIILYDGVRQGSNDGRGTCLDQSNADDLECSGFSQYRTHSCSSSLS